jgi:hypothetical protein
MLQACHDLVVPRAAVAASVGVQVRALPVTMPELEGAARPDREEPREVAGRPLVPSVAGALQFRATQPGSARARQGVPR